MKNIIEQLNWRYAVKKYDAAKKVSDQDMLLLQVAVKLSPSSHGLQPYKILIIKDEAVRAKLQAASYNQSQVTDASHFIVFAVENNVDEAYVDAYFENLCAIRNVKLEGDLLHHRNSVAGSINRMSDEAKLIWATNQTYIALGSLLCAAAQLEIDASPMEGFMPGKYDEILELRKKGLSSVVVVAIGYRHHEDFFQHFTKVRKPDAELFEIV
jgi:nitroreductase